MIWRPCQGDIDILQGLSCKCNSNCSTNFQFDFVLNSDVHQYNTRRKNDYHLKRMKTNWGKQTFSYLSLNDCNTLPSAVKDTDSLNTCKLHFK